MYANKWETTDPLPKFESNDGKYIDDNKDRDQISQVTDYMD